MKKIIAIAAAMLAAVCWLGATEPEAPKNDIRYETKSFDVRNFNSLELSSVYNATLSRSSQCSLKITAPDDIMEYVVVRVSDGTLELSLGSIPNKIQRKYNNGGYDLKAEITMPELCGLEMTGASKISCNDSFDIGNKEFELDLSGATKVNGLNITARSIEGDISGAPYVDLKGKFGSAEMDVSGAFLDCIDQEIMTNDHLRKKNVYLKKLGEFYYSELDLQRLRKEIRAFAEELDIPLD